MITNCDFNENDEERDSMKKRRTRVVLLTLVILALGPFLLHPASGADEPPTHMVKEGDTLWDICETYYGDSDLWPKLWEMNPFVTNPHLLEPGDVITLLEGVPIRTVRAPAEIETPPEPLPVMEGLDVSELTNTNALGFLSPKQVKPLGTIISATTDKMILAEGDTVYVAFSKEMDIQDVKVGDEFTIAVFSRIIRYPTEKKRKAYAVMTRGLIVIEDVVEEPVYAAKIFELFGPAEVGAFVMPYEPVSPCVTPVPARRDLSGYIVETQELKQIIGGYSVVYLSGGFNQGFRRGQVFNIIEDPRKIKTKQVKVSLPPRVLGSLIVLESRPATATALVLNAHEQIFRGTDIEGLSWVETPEALSRLPACPLE
jgi:hypothetical protein